MTRHLLTPLLMLLSGFAGLGYQLVWTQESALLLEMLARVREPLLAVLRISPDFRPAYDPLLAMASALVRSDAGSARQLLGELYRLQPSRGDAAQLLAALGGAGTR